MKEKLHKILPILVFSGILIISLIVRQFVVKAYENKLLASNQELVTISNQRDTKQGQKEFEKQEILDKVTGLDLTRQKHDDELAEKIMSDIFTWDNYETYNDAREKMLDTYKMDERVVNRLMPKVPEVIVDKGRTINEIDANKANMSFEKLKSYVVKISGTDYSYITEVSVESSDRADNTATGKILMTYNVSINGQVTNLNGFTLLH